MIILLDNGHGKETKGKRSPDGIFREYAYTREIAKMVQKQLLTDGYDCRLVVPEDYDVKLQTRCNRVNKICNEVGSENVLLISIHNDAAPEKHKDGWEDGRGWSAWVYRSAGAKSIELANCLFDAAKNKGLKVRQQYFDKKYWTAGYFILKHTQCPAVLTENLFQNNHGDVEFLLSDIGKQTIADLHINGIKKFIKK